MSKTTHNGKSSAIANFFYKDGTTSFISSLMSVAIGLFVGLIIMVVISFVSDEISLSGAFEGLVKLLKGPFASSIHRYVLSNVGNTIFYAVPLICTGLSVAVAYKTGLFNIGAAGQYVMGTMGALMVGLYLQTTNRFAGVLVWALAVLAGMVCGALWGVLSGLLKALFNINEVIVCIMTNWIAANLATWIFSGQSAIISKENTKGAYLIKPLESGNYTPKLGLDKLFPGSYIDIGIIVAIIVAIVIYIIMNKTTFGYELRACGANRHASKYAGLNEKRNIILSMAIAGALAGLGAALYYLNPGIEYNYVSQYSNLPAYGFNGIASAFLANCNPIGVFVSSLFIRYLNMGGEYLNSVGYNRYIADIIIAIIIYTAGFSRFFRELLNKKKRMREYKLAPLDTEVYKVPPENSDNGDTNEEEEGGANNG